MSASPGVVKAYETERSVTRMTLTLRDVVFLIVYTAIVAGAFFALQARVSAMSDAQQEMKQDIRELRQWIEKHP